MTGLEFQSLHEFGWVHGHTGVAVASPDTTGLSQRMEGVCGVCSRHKNHIQQHRFFTMSRVRANNTGTQRSHGFQIKTSHLWPGFALKLKKPNDLNSIKKVKKVTLTVHVYTQDKSQKLAMFSILQCWRRQHFDRVLRYLSIYNPAPKDTIFFKKSPFWTCRGKTSIYKEELSYFKFNALNNLALCAV